MLDETERMALVLGALDAAIANLTTVRDLLAVTLLQEVSPMALHPQALEPDADCPHRHTTSIETMGAQQRFCIDCEQVLDG